MIQRSKSSDARLGIAALYIYGKTTLSLHG